MAKKVKPESVYVKCRNCKNASNFGDNSAYCKAKGHNPTQKPIPLLRRLIEIFTDKGDVVIDPVAGSGSTLLAAAQCGRKAYGFEIDRNFYNDANKYILSRIQKTLFQ